MRKQSRQQTIKILKERFTREELEAQKEQLTNIIDNAKNDNYPYAFLLMLNDIKEALKQ